MPYLFRGTLFFPPENMSNVDGQAHISWIIFPFYDFKIRVRLILTLILENRDSKDSKTFYRLRIGLFFIIAYCIYLSV